ncbi:MAG TPA: efflux RND transporter permease subunit [Candidatus Limnocylindria bacterium]|nr:efflux RND transporter permease subunit [Candidatus Limnocylindria bacterium]
MRLWHVCIERPVLATVLSLVILLVGLVSLGRLQNREFPDIDPPVVSVTTVLPGAAPEVVETSVTQPLEDELIGIAGIRHLTSSSSEQVSQISVEFELGRNVDLAANDVRDRVARALPRLPEEAEQPVVAKRDADAFPVLWLALYGGGYDQIALSTIAETQLQDRLSKLPGVSEIIIAGEQRFSMRVWIDNERLTAHRLTIADVATTLERENVDLPSGRVESRDAEFTVRTLGELSTPEAFGALIVARPEGAPVRLRDVARVEVGPEDERKLVRFNRQPAVALGIVKQSKANTLDVVRAVKAEIEELRPVVPEGVRFDSAFDSSIFIERSLADVRASLIEAIVLVVIVIYLFLRSFRATIVPAIAIPVSLVGTFAVLYFLGFSINTLTLMGLVLAIGLVVDDAIVVLENVTRWVENGTPAREAAHRGMDEIAFAVVAATVSTVAVFLPLAFLTDQTGRLFREFGITVAAAVAISGWVALTLSPMLCARVVRAHTTEHGVKAWLARAFDALERSYGRLLAPVLHHRRATLLAGAAWVGLGLVLLGVVPREFVPAEDRGAVRTFTRAPEGSTLEFTDRYQAQAEDIILAVPEVEKTFSVVALGIGAPGAVNEGAMFTTLHPWEERERGQEEVLADLRRDLAAVPGLQAFPAGLPSLGQDNIGGPISLVIQGPDVAKLAEYADEVVRRGRALPGVVNLRTDLLLNKPQLDVEIDRERANDLGVSVREIARTLQILLGGVDLSTFKLRGETYDVIAQLDRQERAEPRDLYSIYVRGREGVLVPLASVTRVSETVVPRSLPHFDRMRAATITGSLAAGAPLGAALDSLRAIAEDVLPDRQGYRVDFSGESEDFYESSQALLFAYFLAVAIIYLVLAAQFESFLDPITILIAVALSFSGALVTLIATGQSLNLFSQIGLVMLVGLVTKNSILIVEFANQLHAGGRTLVSATLEASRTRFRPILMTALSTIVGILPIALGLGAGGESRAPLGIAVAGGMLFSTILTFFVVPAAHVSLQGLRELWRRRARAHADASRRAAA